MKINEFKDELRNALVKKCSERNSNYDNNNVRGMCFEDWCFELIKDEYPHSENTIDECVLRSRDYKLDIHFPIPENEEVYFIQCKHEKPAANDPINPDHVETFFNRYDLLKTNKLLDASKNVSKQVEEISNQFDYYIKDKFKINFVFISTGTESEQCKFLKDHYNNKFFKHNVNFEIWDIYSLKDEYLRIKSIDENYPEEVKWKLSEGNYVKVDGSRDHMSFIVKGTMLHELYWKEKTKLFNWNIRSFLGKKGQVNTGMKQTLENAPENFFYFNNGISALCNEFSFNDNTRELNITKFQVVNGAQTVGAIAHVAKSHKDKLSDVRVLIKLTSVKGASREKGIAAEIIKANNTQNTLRIPDFRANDKIQLWIDHEFTKLKNKGKLGKLIYGRKRPYKRAQKNETLIKMMDLGKIRYSWFHDPRIAIGAPNKLFLLKEDGGVYEDAFGENSEIGDMWTEKNFNETILSIHAWNQCNIELKKASQEEFNIDEDVYNFERIERLRFYGLNLFKRYVDNFKYSEEINIQDLYSFEKKFEKVSNLAMKVIIIALKNTYKGILKSNEGVFSLPRDSKIWDAAKEHFQDACTMQDSFNP